MIRHSMDYVQRAEKVMDELDKVPFELWVSKKAFVDAEGAIVKAYGFWRAGMEKAAADGNELAARYLKESEWDLT